MWAISVCRPTARQRFARQEMLRGEGRLRHSSAGHEDTLAGRPELIAAFRFHVRKEMLHIVASVPVMEALLKCSWFISYCNYSDISGNQ